MHQHDIPIICLLQHQSLREPRVMQKHPIRLLDSALQQDQSLATAPSSAPAGLTLLEVHLPHLRHRFCCHSHTVWCVFTQRCMSNKHTCRGEGSTLYCCFSNTAYYVLVRITKEIKWQTTLKSIYTEYCSGKNNFLNLSGVLGQTKESIFLMVCI